MEKLLVKTKNNSPNTNCYIRKDLLSCFKNKKFFNYGLEADSFIFKKWRGINNEYFKKNGRLYGRNPVDHIFNVFLTNKYRKSSSFKVADQNFRANLKSKITSIVEKNEQIVLVLPSFPFKTGSF